MAMASPLRLCCRPAESTRMQIQIPGAVPANPGDGVSSIFGCFARSNIRRCVGAVNPYN